MEGADVQRCDGMILLLVLSACAASTPASTTTPQPAASESAVATESVEPSAAAAPEAAAEAQAALALDKASDAADPAAKDGVLGIIERRGLIEIVDAGLGRLFQQLKVSASLDKGRFVGFQITSIHPRWTASTLQTGDVVVALNGMPVERPEQAMAAFERLRQADTLEVSLLRGGAPMTLRFRIE